MLLCEEDLKCKNSFVNQDSASPNLDTQAQRDEEVDFADKSESENLEYQSTRSSDDEAHLEIVNNDLVLQQRQAATHGWLVATFTSFEFPGDGCFRRSAWHQEH